MSPFTHAVCSLTVLSLASPLAMADLTLISSDRTLAVTADTLAGRVLDESKPFTGPGLWNDSLDAFALLSPNVIAGSTFQRSQIPTTLTRPGSALLQGSASLVASVFEQTPFNAHAVSSITYVFEVDAPTQVRFVWSLEGLGYQRPRLGSEPAKFSLFEGSEPTPIGTLLRESAGVGQVNTSFATLDLDPGVYTIEAGAYTQLFQGESLSGSGLFEWLPAEAQQSAGYTVSMSIVPGPAAALPLLIAVGGLATRRRRP